MKYEKESKKKPAKTTRKRKAKPVTKPVHATKPALPEVTEKTVAPEPAPAPDHEGFEVVGKWSGLDQCRCNYCGDLIIHVEKAKEHVYSQHLEPVLMMAKEVKSPIVDAQGEQITKTVFEPLTEEKDNG